MNAFKLKKNDKVVYMHAGSKSEATVIKVQKRSYRGCGDSLTKIIKMPYILLDDGENERPACLLQVLIDAAEKKGGKAQVQHVSSKEDQKAIIRKRLLEEIRIARSNLSNVKLSHEKLLANKEDKENRHNRLSHLKARVRDVEDKISFLEEELSKL